MNEAENQVIPNEADAILIDASDFIDNDDEDKETGETVAPATEEVSTPAETKEQEVDYAPLLNKLKENVKYMDQEVVIDSVDDVIKNYQKGLDYDRKSKKIEELENSDEMIYIREKSKENGMTPAEYIKALKDYEVTQAKEQEEAEVNEMVENGVAETIARKVIETNRMAKELAQEKLNIKNQQDELAKSKAKEAENDLFLQAYPNIDVKTIPKEVFVDAEKSNLLTAYTKYENEQLKKQLALLKQNESNEKSSPVKGTTEHGGVVVEKQDDFLTGLLGQ